MALTFLYRDLDATDTDVTPYVVLRFGQNPQGMAENAEERSVGAWDLEIEDNGVLDLHAQRTFYVLEDDTDYADNVLWVGQTFDKHSGRGDTWRTGPGRVYTLNLIDLNTLLERRLIQSGDDPNRPEETDVERMLWLQGLGYIGVTDDWISTADPVDMDAVDYTGRMAAEVIEDCMGQSGKNSFMFRDPDTDTFAVYYGDSSADTDILTSDIRLSNVLSDIDNVTTFEVNLDADQWEANSRIYSGIYASFDGGAVYQENATTVANFSHRDTTVSWPDVKTATKANARAIRYLADIGTEEIRITCAAEVGSDQVGLFPHAGWRLQARFSHYPLFAENFTWMRILSRNTTLIGPNRYRVQYELSPGTSHPPLSCSVAVSDAETWASHYYTNEEGGPGGWVSPRTETVDDPTGVPGVVFACWVARRVGDTMGVDDSVVIGGDYTELFNTRDDAGPLDSWQTVASLSYNATTGDAGSISAAWSPDPASTYQFFSAFIPTTATAPVQVGVISGGDPASLPGMPTVGNMLVAMIVTEHALTDLTAPSGWTLLNAKTVIPGLLGVGAAIIAHCVEEGDGTDYEISGGSFSHWGAISEWAVTE